MCDCTTEVSHSPWQAEKKYRIADFFNRHWERYKSNPTEYIKPEQYKAVNAIRSCQTAVLGVDMYACKKCGTITEKYHCCNNRFCPSCSWMDTVRWAETQTSRMMNIKHRHAVFTLPHALNPLIKLNRKALYTILMQTSADTFKDWQMHKFGVTCGIISVLHTFGETKQMHVHVHMIVSWGGIDEKTGLLKEIGQEFVKFGFLKDKFRNKFEDKLVQLYDQGKLVNEFSDRIDFMQLLKQINNQNWIIHVEPPMASPKEVITYIGRYSKRACLSEYKITNMEGEYIRFKYRDYKNRKENNRPEEKELELHYSDFFPRLLQHVPLPYFHIVRYYGKYHPKSKINKTFLFNPKTQKQDWAELQATETGRNPLYCEVCNCFRIYSFTVFDTRRYDMRVEKFDMSKHEHLIYVKNNRYYNAAA